MSNETTPPNPDAVEIEIQIDGTSTREQLVFRRAVPSDMVLVAIVLHQNEIFIMVRRQALLEAAQAIATDPEPETPKEEAK